MKFDFGAFVNNLPKELADIALQNFNLQGHATAANSQAKAIRSLLRKNGGTSQEKFMNDMKTLFPHVSSREAANYYEVFVDALEFATEQ